MEQYISEVYKNLKLPKAKKDELIQQFETNCRIALSQGATLEQLIETMGDAKTVAEAFNSSISAEELKKMNRFMVIKIVAAVVLVFAFVEVALHFILPSSKNLATSQYFNQDAIAYQSEIIMDSICNDQFDVIYSMANDDLKATLTTDYASVLSEAKKEKEEDWGNFVSYGKFSMSELNKSGEIVAVTNCKVAYANATVTYALSFDQNMQLCGIYFH